MKTLSRPTEQVDKIHKSVTKPDFNIDMEACVARFFFLTLMNKTVHRYLNEAKEESIRCLLRILNYGA